MWKKAAFFINVILMLFLLTGCWDYIEIDEQITVTGIAIDAGNSGKRYNLTAEIVTGGNKNNVEVNIIETEGDTVFEAIRNLMTISSRKLYFGHCKLMVIGEDIAKYGINEMLDISVRNQELRANVDIVVTKNCTAKEVLMTKGVVTPIISYKIFDMISNAKEALGNSQETEVYRVFNSIQTEKKCTVIPALEIWNIEDVKIIKLVGSGVFKQDKLVGYINELQTKNLALIIGKLDEGLLTTEAFNEHYSNISFEVYKNKAKWNLKFDNDEIYIDVKLNTTVTIGEAGPKIDFSNRNEVEKTRAHLEKFIENDINLLINTAQNDFNCDIFGVGMKIREQHPEIWENYKDNWEETFPKIKFSVKSKVKIRGSGVSNTSI